MKKLESVHVSASANGDSVGPLDLYQLTPEEVALLEARKQPTGRWKPKKNEKCYYVNEAGLVQAYQWLSLECDEWMYSQRRLFQTPQQAQSHLAYLNALAELRDSSDYVPAWDGVTPNFFVKFNHTTNRLVGDCASFHDCGAAVYYPTAELMEQAIKEHEAAWKTYFGVQE